MGLVTPARAVRCFAAILLLLRPTPATLAQDFPGFERVLIPISVSQVPGAYDTLWSTELWFRNNSDVPVAIFPLAVSDWVPTIGWTEFLPVGSFPAHAPGQIIYVSREGIEEVQFDLRLFNRNDPEGAWGTKLPVVREREFGNAVSLINVPTGLEFRSALRIYGLPDVPGGIEAVRVQVYSDYEHLLAERLVVLQGTPRYASILSLADDLPEIRQGERVRIHVEAANPAAKIWAFVSVISNHSQNVAVVTPH